MKDKIEAYLKDENRWKIFINIKKDDIEKASLVRLMVSNIQAIGTRPLFNVDMVYKSAEGKEKKSEENGYVEIDEKENIHNYGII